MKTTFEVNNFLFTLVASIGTTLTGGVYKMERPRNSKSEDIVVSSLPINEGENPVEVTCNVNIHVPNVLISIDGFPHQVANNVRLKAIADILLAAIDQDITAAGIHYRVISQTIFEEPAMNEHFYNIRLELRMY